jgi:hypothetical protein
MGKVSENKFVGQPILRQIVNILPREKFDELVIRLGSDKYYKAFFSWDQLIVMLFGIFSVAIRWVKSVTACVPGWQVELPGHGEFACKKTAGDALRDRDEELFRLFYFALIAHFSTLLSVSCIKRSIPTQKTRYKKG